VSPRRRRPLHEVVGFRDAVSAAWPVELGYDGEALCARCLRPLRGPDGLRLGGSGSITTVALFVAAVSAHIDEGCPCAGDQIEYHDHGTRA
jgi:hypothetical protein